MSTTRVLTFGTFDHFHDGHAFYLSEAKKYGDELIVVIARDETVKAIKGAVPDFGEKLRKKAVEASGIATTVVLGDKNDKYKVIKKYKPTTIALGYDQYAFTQRLQKFLIDEGMNTNIVRIDSFKPSEYKSSIIKAKLKHSNEKHS